MKYKFNEEVTFKDEFYSNASGRIIGYDYDQHRIPEQQYLYSIRLYSTQGYVDRMFWEFEIA